MKMYVKELNRYVDVPEFIARGYSDTLISEPANLVEALVPNSIVRKIISRTVVNILREYEKERDIMTDIRYYIKHPNGRTRIQATSDEKAKELFNDHWTAKTNWREGNRKRTLIKETREEIAEHIISTKD